MGLLVSLIKGNIVPIMGMLVHGLLVIGLTIIGGKLLQWANLIGFDSGESEHRELAKGIVIVGLLLSFSLIVIVGSYQPAPEVVMAQATDRVVQGGEGGGGCSHKFGANKTSGDSAATKFPCGKPIQKGPAPEPQSSTQSAAKP